MLNFALPKIFKTAGHLKNLAPIANVFLLTEAKVRGTNRSMTNSAEVCVWVCVCVCVSEWVSEWVSECVCVCVFVCKYVCKYVRYCVC